MFNITKQRRDVIIDITKEMQGGEGCGMRCTTSGGDGAVGKTIVRHLKGDIKSRSAELELQKKTLVLKILFLCLLVTTFVFPLYVIESGMIMNRGVVDHLKMMESSKSNQKYALEPVSEFRNNRDNTERKVKEDYSYDDIYASNGLHESYRDRRLTDFTSFETYTNADVIDSGCRLTTVLLDPRIPEAPFDHAVWYSLESVATYAPYTCVVLQTSACKLVSSYSTPQSQIQTITERIYERSLPEFRRLMERGMVRISILNHAKYKLASCSNFFNPSSALMNINYWKDEFITNVDSDIILVVQDDAVLCHHFDVNLWDDVAFVGGIWPPKWSYKFGWCQQLSVLWRALTIKKRLRLTRERNPESKTVSVLQNLCTNGYGPTGNGGFSLRNRNWMIRAIDECPHPPFSGVPVKSGNECILSRFQNEDLYFATVLLGLRAPIPTAYEAALFSTEMLWPEQAEEFYGPLNDTQRAKFLENRWGADGLSMFKRMHNPTTYGTNFNATLLRTISIGLHKPWHYQPNTILTGSQIMMECKFLKYIFTPSMSKYDGATWRFPNPPPQNQNYALHESVTKVTTPTLDEKAILSLVVESIEQPLHNTSIPHILWFTYSHNILRNKEPSHFYDNILKTIQKYRSSFQGLFQKKLAESADVKVIFIDNEQCHKIVQLAYPPLASYFLQEKEGNFKSDICRVAALYLYGGYYFDIDMEVINPYVVEDLSKTTFVSVRDTEQTLFQSFVASTARNPVLKKAFDVMLEYYEGRHKKCTRQNSCLMGTHTLMDAYRAVIASSAIQTVLLYQDKLRPSLYPDVPRRSRPGCNFVVHDPIQSIVHFYSRIEGSSGCPFSTNSSENGNSCGGGVVGNGICPDPTFCCSRYGWCGKTPQYCKHPAVKKKNHR